MNESEALRGTLANTICNASNYPRRATPYLLGEDMSPVLDKTADAILAAGYRRLRTVTSLADLDALPDGTVIRDNIGVIRERFDDEDTGSALWLRTGSGGWALSKQCHLPATVLHEPEATK